MKKLITTMLFLLVSLSSFANTEDIFCAVEAAHHYKKIVVVKNFAKDKYKHCTISCIVGIECGVASSALIGVAKEIYDVFGPGNAELEDLLANVLGLRISRRASVTDLSSCSQACQHFYPIPH
ncbi:hypothetical protein [Bacteriovorax sp. DB6_IX]|uniref:hypothetical protein n=1 Tax=Bacteriovorax sp. DB6_IX TaxID=1353530 RepID=UPI00038A509C|nr:hypothetical protein [Bacteriovorax sp. DB6_IX]EQC48122.1 hypothetical protein M901_0511 [Bacteriovorax sp. DB6_IX]